MWVPTNLPGFSDATGHGSYVTDLAAGSVEHGEDPSLKTTLDEVARSGTAPGAHVNFYWEPPNSNTGAIAAGILQSTINGDSVINNSCGHLCSQGSGSNPPAVSCPTTDDFSNINEDLQAANAAGEMTTIATGDYDSAIGYPAGRPEVIGVGWASSSPTTNANADTAPHFPGSGIGPLSLGVYNEGTSVEAGVGLIAPGQINLMAVASASRPPTRSGCRGRTRPTATSGPTPARARRSPRRSSPPRPR